jgi:hypothetical protein
MRIMPIAGSTRLFAISHVLPNDLVHGVMSLDWLNLPWQRQEAQELWLRRKIIVTSCLQLVQANNYIKAHMAKISERCGISITDTNTSWWVDEPGFQVQIHMDNPRVGFAMQTFWKSPNQNLGTEFYHSNNAQDLWHKFKFEANNGYVMINRPEPPGKTLPWHGMTCPVPANTYRVTSYTNAVLG